MVRCWVIGDIHASPLTKLFNMNQTNSKNKSISNVLGVALDGVFREGSKTQLRIKQLALPLKNFEKK